MPQDDLVPGTWYNLTVPPGITLVDGTTTTESMDIRFQAPCDPAPCAAEEPPPETVAEPDEKRDGADEGCQSGRSVGFGWVVLLLGVVWMVREVRRPRRRT